MIGLENALSAAREAGVVTPYRGWLSWFWIWLGICRNGDWRSHGSPLSEAGGALQAFEIDPVAAEKAVQVVRSTLLALDVPSATAIKLARS